MSVDETLTGVVGDADEDGADSSPGGAYRMVQLRWLLLVLLFVAAGSGSTAL